MDVFVFWLLRCKLWKYIIVILYQTWWYKWCLDTVPHSSCSFSSGTFCDMPFLMNKGWSEVKRPEGCPAKKLLAFKYSFYHDVKSSSSNSPLTWLIKQSYQLNIVIQYKREQVEKIRLKAIWMGFYCRSLSSHINFHCILIQLHYINVI